MRQLKNFNEDEFLRDLRMNEWNRVFVLNNPYEMWNFRKHLLMSVIDKRAPRKTKELETIDLHGLQMSCYAKFTRDFIKKKTTSKNDSMTWKGFKDARNKVNNSIKKGKRKYFRRNWTQVNVICVKHCD